MISCVHLATYEAGMLPTLFPMFMRVMLQVISRSCSTQRPGRNFGRWALKALWSTLRRPVAQC